MEITAAAKLVLELGVALELNCAMTFENHPLKTEISALNMNDLAAEIVTSPTHVRMGALVNKLVGAYIVV